MVARIQMDQGFVLQFSSVFFSLQYGGVGGSGARGLFWLILLPDFKGEKTLLWIHFLAHFFFFFGRGNFFDSFLSTSAYMCGMWCWMLLHHRITECQVMPWQEKTAAESQWRGSNGKRVAPVEERPGGRACWEGSMAHLTPTYPPLKLGRSVRTTQTPSRLEMRQSSCFRWVCTVGRVYFGMKCWCMPSRGGGSKQKSAHFLRLHWNRQQSGSFKQQFGIKSSPRGSFFYSYFLQYVGAMSLGHDHI